jgi:hypothetical protein
MKNSDEAIDRALARLRDAEVPEGLEARIAAKLEGHAAVRDVAGVRWRDLFSGTAAAGVWWRGAVSGVAVAMLLVGLVWMVGHRGRSGAGDVVVRERPVAAVSPAAVVGVAQVKPCATPGLLGVAHVVTHVRRDDGVRVAEAQVSHPAPAMGLTAQERKLVQLARKGDAKNLAPLDPEMRAKAEAQDAAEFQKFFAEPVRVEAAPVAEPAVDNQ